MGNLSTQVTPPGRPESAFPKPRAPQVRTAYRSTRIPAKRGERLDLPGFGIDPSDGQSRPYAADQTVVPRRVLRGAGHASKGSLKQQSKSLGMWTIKGLWPFPDDDLPGSSSDLISGPWSSIGNGTTAVVQFDPTNGELFASVRCMGLGCDAGQSIWLLKFTGFTTRLGAPSGTRSRRTVEPFADLSAARRAPRR
jgi:hypothetical protein